MGRRRPANPPAFSFIIFPGVAKRDVSNGTTNFIVTVTRIIIGPTVSENAVGHTLRLGVVRQSLERIKFRSDMY